ncbi:MAG TPA: PmoA family protein [Cyclobacteriaceae bacterium]
MIHRIVHTLFAVILVATCTSRLLAQGSGFSFHESPAEKKIDVLYNGKVLTAYCYFDSVMKPVLYPVKTVSGVTVTRGYPLDPRPGERVDHPHHVGLWMNYESVNGLDFWNNSTAIPYARRPHYGTIYHDKVVSKKASGKKATLEVNALWKDHNGKLLLLESTTYGFKVDGDNFIIDRMSTLKAAPNTEVTFKDAKDGFLAIRVARELELPSNEPAKYVDNSGIVTEVAALSNEGVSGDYLSSEGIRGDDVWSTRAKWVTLSGKKDNHDVSITIIDHPGNPGYPAYWHARGYGLFAVNPLGQEIFSKGKEKLNLMLKPGESVTFRYRIVIHEGKALTQDQIAAMAKF